MPRPRKIFTVKHGWFEDDGKRTFEGHFVQDDTMPPLFNHMDGKWYDSKSKYVNSIEGSETPDGKRYRIMGNDYKGKLEVNKSKPISYDQFRDAKEYAQSVARDPAKLRAWRSEQDDIRAEYRKCGLGDD